VWNSCVGVSVRRHNYYELYIIVLFYLLYYNIAVATEEKDIMKDKIKQALSYRKARRIKEIFVCRNGDSFPVCPKCKSTLERDYQAFCDRCGQKLKWKKYYKAKLIYK